MSKTQFYIIPKEKIDNLIDYTNDRIKLHKENPMSEKSIELRAVIDTLEFITKNSTLQNGN